MRIVAIEIGKKGTRITNGDYGRRNLARAFVADNRRPARLPARSAVTAYTDPRSRGSRKAFANERRDAASALAGLLPELSYDSFGEFNRDTLHAHGKRVTHA
jgi:hypothetical protein